MALWMKINLFMHRRQIIEDVVWLGEKSYLIFLCTLIEELFSDLLKSWLVSQKTRNAKRTIVPKLWEVQCTSQIERPKKALRLAFQWTSGNSASRAKNRNDFLGSKKIFSLSWETQESVKNFEKQQKSGEKIKEMSGIHHFYIKTFEFRKAEN